MRFFVRHGLSELIISVLLVFCLSFPINAAIIPEDRQINNKTVYYKMGDADSDKSITAADARAVLRATVGLHSFSPELYAYCDCNYNGTVDVYDARTVLRTAVGLEKQEEHSFEFSELKPSDCTEAGSYAAKCRDCAKEVNGEIPELAHIFDSGIFLSEPTPTEKATKSFTCTLCGYVKNVKISYCDYYSHKWSTESLKNKPVCKICKFSDAGYKLSREEFTEIIAGQTDKTEITDNLIAISDNCGSRWYSFGSNKKVTEYISDKLHEYGFRQDRLIYDSFYINGTELKNIYAKIPTAVKNPDIVMLCAHFDSAVAGKGAIDNGSGVSTLLEIARILNITGADYGCEIRLCFLNGEEMGYYGAYRYCWYISQPEENSAPSIERHKYILNLDMTGKPNSGKDYYLCVSTEPVTASYKYRKAESNPTSNAITAAKKIVGNCTETAFYSPVSAGMHDLLAFRKYGLSGVTLSWREKAAEYNNCDYNLMAPAIIHTDADTVKNIDLLSLHKTTLLVSYTAAGIVYDYYYR